LTLVLFDVDGTLIDAGGAGRWALDRAFEDTFSLKGVDSRSAGVVFDGRTDPLIIEDIAAHLGVQPSDLAPARGRLEGHYLERLKGRLAGEKNARALPGVADLLRELRRSAVPYGLLTGNIERGAMLKLAACGLDTAFEWGAFGSDGADRAGLGRLARDRFEARLGRNFEPREVVVVGDSILDVRAARANGYRALAVETGWTPREQLVAESPDRLAADLSDIASITTWIVTAA